MNLRLTRAARDAMLRALLDAGSILIYSGVQPETADDAVAQNAILLATLNITEQSFVQNGMISFVVEDTSVSFNDTATFGRVLARNGAPMFDGDVKADGKGLINFQKVEFAAGSKIGLDSFTISIPDEIEID
jgi:hypothetical protein